MADVHLECRGCGLKFLWTDKEQKEYEEANPTDEEILEVEPYCKTCRPKQDSQRS